MTANPLWFVDRSAGEVTLLLLSCVMILGILRSALPTVYPRLVEGLHTNLALLAVAFGVAHVLAAVLDPFAHLGPLDALVPFASRYRPAWLGLGVVSGYLIAFVVITSWPARRLPRTAWLWLHRTMYAGWLVAFVHALGTGSDTTNRLFLLLDLAAVGGVLVVFLSYRVTESWPKRPLLWAPVAAVALAAVLGLAAWTVTGPLQPGWARSSGTPPDLLRTR
jgi:methionine sulfoxide reductase heme-binding subunit